ncbi:hypothetical protein [Micromonospora sp. NPDC023814]|uniref:hypothetical protein n=1 Tax=Micromonospora sp. NPDC023814 TaxID=3154596 RepID=UPI0033CE992A
MRMDEERVTDLLRRLDDEPAGPPRIDVPGAIREARRRRRNRRVAVAGAAAFGVLAAAALPAALHGGDGATPAPAGVSVSPVPPTPKPSPPGPWQGKCEAALLPAPDSAAPGSEVTGGDPDGRWLVGHLSPNGSPDHRVLIWDAGRAREVEIPGTYQELRDVNRAGLAVGSTRRIGGGLEAWAVRDGQPVRLSVIGPGAARAVNDAGRIVGYRRAEEVREPWRQDRPVVWDSYEAKAVDLPLPGPGWAGSAIGIDEDGTVLANMADLTNGDPGQPRRAVVWRPGATRPEVLPLPRVPGGVAFQFFPVSLAGGWVTGTAYRETKPGERGSLKGYRVRIDLRTGQADVLSADVTTGAVNSRGWIAGVLSSNVPVVVTDTKTVTLPGPDGKTGVDGWVRSISDDARVLGGQLYLNNRGWAVRWTCR